MLTGSALLSGRLGSLQRALIGIVMRESKNTGRRLGQGARLDPSEFKGLGLDTWV